MNATLVSINESEAEHDVDTKVDDETSEWDHKSSPVEDVLVLSAFLLLAVAGGCTVKEWDWLEANGASLFVELCELLNVVNDPYKEGDHPGWIHPFHSVLDTEQGNQVIGHTKEDRSNSGINERKLMVELWLDSLDVAIFFCDVDH